MLAFLDTLFGLPAHPLLVHVPVVVMPLTALGLVVMALSPSWRARIGWLVVVGTFLDGIAVQLAMSSGEALQDHVGERALVQHHAELADLLRPLALLLFLVALGLMLLDRRRARPGAPALPSWVGPVVAVVAVLAAIGSVVQMTRVGHSGADAVWHDKGTQQPRQGRLPGGDRD